MTRPSWPKVVGQWSSCVLQATVGQPDLTGALWSRPGPQLGQRVQLRLEQQGRRVRVAWVRRVRRRTTGQCAAAGEGEDEGVDEGVDAAGEQGEARRRGAPLAGMANSSPVETPSGSPATSCGRV